MIDRTSLIYAKKVFKFVGEGLEFGSLTVVACVLDELILPT